MPKPRVLVLRAPGTNCDAETSYAFELAGAQPDVLHLFRVLENPDQLRQYQALCIPGGFSYGDDLGAGVIFGAQLRGKLADRLREFLHRDTLLLGICNGFQVLMRAGLLPYGKTNWPPAENALPDATLTWNNNGRYTCRWVHLRTAGSRSVFFRNMAAVDIPMAHGEGRIAVRKPAVLDHWKSQGQIAATYAPGPLTAVDSGPATVGGASSELYPEPVNPNGSLANIAGLCDPTGRILGLMPHPERHIFATQHPHWTRRPRTSDEGECLQLFRNAVAYFG